MSTVQGSSSSLSPTLCLINISDLCDNVNSRVRLFPAGTTYCRILNAADSTALHQDFQALRGMESKWQMDFNDSRFDILSITDTGKLVYIGQANNTSTFRCHKLKADVSPEVDSHC